MLSSLPFRFIHLEPAALERRVQRRVRSLHPSLLASLKFLELRMIDIDRRRNIARLPHVRIARALGIVTRQRIRTLEVERPSTRSRRAAAGAVRQLLSACSAMGTYLPGCDPLFLVPEDVAREEVDDAKDYDDDAAGDDDLPGGGSEGFLGRGFLV